MNTDSQNIGITNDDIERAKKYKEALDNLKSSVIGLNISYRNLPIV
ncbi:hypothetical protein GWR56_11190 [Mucilaginibacter sp. 14171R-50]|nr:hypothetical protein [Mucilaginibacter sp. 14171R-50]QHS56070.1 hypothetical protein GWR56_11190 [Mucilaginibacter sp. 14171R-50]